MRDYQVREYWEWDHHRVWGLYSTMFYFFCRNVCEDWKLHNLSFVQRQKRIAIYHVKKFVKDSHLWKQTLSILQDFLDNWHFISHFVWKSTKTLELLRIFDELFDVINGEPFLTLYKTSVIDIYTDLWTSQVILASFEHFQKFFYLKTKVHQVCISKNFEKQFVSVRILKMGQCNG